MSDLATMREVLYISSVLGLTDNDWTYINYDEFNPAIISPIQIYIDKHRILAQKYFAEDKDSKMCQFGGIVFKRIGSYPNNRAVVNTDFDFCNDLLKIITTDDDLWIDGEPETTIRIIRVYNGHLYKLKLFIEKHVP